MSRAHTFLMAGTAALVGTAASLWHTSAQAADYSPPCVPPPQCMATAAPSMGNPVPSCISPPGPLCAMPLPPPPMPVAQEFGGWYLRGDIGMSSQNLGSLFNVLYNNPGTTVSPMGMVFDSAPTFGVGIGWQYNSWIRFDATAEYRGRANFKGSDNVSFPDGGGTAILADNYTGSKSELLFMANGYVDLGTWWGCLTPFVGAGVGVSRVTISGFRDDGLGIFSDGTPFHSVAYGDSASKWNFAWAIHAGLAYKLSPGVSLELAYRYLNLGDGVTGDLVSFDGTNSVNNPMHFRNLTSHDFKLGVRWALDPSAGPGSLLPVSLPSYAPPPAYPQPSYAPPAYSPPLSRRG